MNSKSLVVALAALVACFSSARSEQVTDRAYDGSEVIHGTVQNQGDGSCGTLNFNADGTYENGYAWRYHGVVAPYYGAFAECYSAPEPVTVCSVVLDLTQIGSYAGQPSDIYVWDDAGGNPGNVLCVRLNFLPGAPAFWPSISRHTATLDGCCATGNFWVGYWGNWPNAGTAYFIGADLDGFGGCPRTNIAPDIGFPTGWQNVSVAWGPTQALGIGAETYPCGGTATQSSTWGAIKNLYRN